ncbi:MAG: hypothetical protein AAGN46_10775 [Acidobacteriota bacterium]
MRQPHAILLVVSLFVCTLVAGEAQAQFFTVTMDNGTSFETRYKPIEANWDDDVVLIMTDQGNWTALRKDEITDVSSEAEESGFGYRVDTATLFLGWTPNDLVDDGEGGGEGDGGDGGSRYEAFDAPLTEPGVNDYTLEQFVDPIGGATIPVGIDYSSGAAPGSSAPSEGRDSTLNDG